MSENSSTATARHYITNKICLQILELFEDPFQTKYGEFKVSISIGASKFPQDTSDLRELISFADVAMLKVKKSGGNSFSMFDAREKSLITQRLELEQEITQAIENKNFEVCSKIWEWEEIFLGSS